MPELLRIPLDSGGSLTVEAEDSTTGPVKAGRVNDSAPAALGSLPCAAALATPQTPAQLLAARSSAIAKLVWTQKAIPATRFSYYATSTVWSTSNAKGWTSGYLPGELWLADQLTNEARFRELAQTRQSKIRSLNTTPGATDIGQRYLYSLAKGYDMTGNRSYRDAVLFAAKQQAARFSPIVGAVRSRNATDSYQVIMDDLMNVQVLYWASRHGGSPALAAIAHQHALTVARDFIRPDGSTYHLVSYVETTGAVAQKTTSQGYSADSSWSRGQAWAIYGLTVAYRETRDPALLDAARRVTDWYLAHLPEDNVPYWDFSAPDIPLAPRDSSAAPHGWTWVPGTGMGD